MTSTQPSLPALPEMDVVADASGVLYTLPPELAIDTAVARRVIGEFIRGQLRQAGFTRALLGLSGGIDSALVAFLAADAIGEKNLLCVSMPYATSSRESLTDAEAVVSALGCEYAVVEITPMVDGYFGTALPDGVSASPLRRGNFMARMRMATLYDQSATWNGLVVGTGNKTEALIGYTTHFGDDASAFNPIGDLYKSQVRQLAVAMGVPAQIVRKAPSADLWPGQRSAEGALRMMRSGTSRAVAICRTWLLYRSPIGANAEALSPKSVV